MKINKKNLYTTLFIIFALLVFSVSSYPRLEIPKKIPRFFSMDKLAHMSQYIVFAFLYFKMRQARAVFIKEIRLELFFLGILISFFDDYKQNFIPGRDFEWGDVFANFMGFLVVLTSIRNNNGK